MGEYLSSLSASAHGVPSNSKMPKSKPISLVPTNEWKFDTQRCVTAARKRVLAKYGPVLWGRLADYARLFDCTWGRMGVTAVVVKRASAFELEWGRAIGAFLELPLAMLWQLALSIRARRRLEAIAAAAVLQWCIVLAVFGLLPLALWR